MDDPTGTGVVVGRAQEQFLYAYNATLTIPVLTGNYLLYVEDASLEATGGFNFRGATGILEGPSRVELDGQDLFVQGDGLELQLAGNGVLSPFAAALTGDVERAEVDGRSVVYAYDASASWMRGVLWMVLVVGAVVATGSASWLHRRPRHWHDVNVNLGGDRGSILPNQAREERGVGYWLLAKDANKHGRHRRSLHYAKRAQSLFPLFAEATLARGVAEAHLGRHETALKNFVDAMAGLMDSRKQAMACIGCSLSCLRMDNEEAAVEWVRQALQADREQALAMLEFKAFDALAGNEEYQSLRALTRQRAEQPEPHDPAVG